MADLESESQGANAFSALAHDIRNVLQSINGGNQMVEQALVGDDIQRVESAWRQVRFKQESLARLMDCILLLQQESLGTARLIPADRILTRTVRLFGPQAENLGVTLQQEFDCELLKSKCWPEWIQNCLTCLLELSLSSCRPGSGGTVSIAGTRTTNQSPPDSIEISIADDRMTLTDEELRVSASPETGCVDWSCRAVYLVAASRLANRAGGTLAAENRDQGWQLTLSVPDSRE